MPVPTFDNPVAVDPPRMQSMGWSLGLDASSSAEVIESVHRGFSTMTLERMRSNLGLSDEEIAEIVGASPRTLARRRKSGRLDPSESDRLYRLARLFELAVDVFGADEPGLEEARQWFHTPQWALGGSTPLSYAGTEPGAREVEALLHRIDYGVLT